MNSAPDVSVLMPVYNTSALLPRALASLFAQKTSRTLEIVLVNDASPDNAAEVLPALAAKDPRIRLIVEPVNRGTYLARKHALSAARGRYILCLDADDELDDDTVEELCILADREQADVVGIGARLLREGADNRYADTLDASRRCLTGTAVFEEIFCRHSYNWGVCLKMIRRDLFLKAVNALPDIYCIASEDFYTYAAVAFFARKFVNSGKIFYNYHIGIGVTGRRMNLAAFEHFASIFDALSGVRRFLCGQGVFDRYADAFREREKEQFAYVFERWPWQIEPSGRAACLEIMRRRYDPAIVDAYLAELFSAVPAVAEEALHPERFPEPHFAVLPPPPCAADHDNRLKRLCRPLKFLFPTESPQWSAAKRCNDFLKGLR